ncbi:MAG: hypothetical protein ACJARP_002149 [Vicingaceae bacterium]|jgi:hypothetical protein
MKVDQIFQFEKINTEVKFLFDHFDYKLKAYPVLHATHSKNYRDFYTDKNIQLIAQKCKKDIEYFNYSF